MLQPEDYETIGRTLEKARGSCDFAPRSTYESLAEKYEVSKTTIERASSHYQLFRRCLGLTPSVWDLGPRALNRIRKSCNWDPRSGKILPYGDGWGRSQTLRELFRLLSEKKD
jgi:hypothetical protein